MKICVTGSNGFVGRHTVRKLIETKHQILGIDRSYSGYLGSLRVDITTDVGSLERAFEHFKPDAVLHLAANASLQNSLADPVYDAMQNIIGTLNVLGAAQKAGVKRFVFTSTSAVYGPKPPGQGKYRETDKVKPKVPYGVSKAAGEMYVACSGIPYAILRYGNVYGPGQKPLGENILIARTLAHMKGKAKFQINGDGEQVRDWVYVGDVAEANLAALFSPIVGTFNIATGKGTDVNSIVRILQNLIDFKGPIEHGPEKSGELREVVLDSKSAETVLNWEAQTKLTDGLEETQKAWMS